MSHCIDTAILDPTELIDNSSGLITFPTDFDIFSPPINHTAVGKDRFGNGNSSAINIVANRRSAG